METSGLGSAATHSGAGQGPQAQAVPHSTTGWMEARPSSGFVFFFNFVFECFGCIRENSSAEVSQRTQDTKMEVEKACSQRLLD